MTIANEPNTNFFQTLTAQFMEIQDITWGTGKNAFWRSEGDGYIIRFRGRLKIEKTDAQKELDLALAADKISSVITTENQLDVILLIHDELSHYVRQVFNIEQTTWGSPSKPEICQYIGVLRVDSVEAYARLEEVFKKQKITPIFRIENGKQVIKLLDFAFETSPSNPWVNLVMIILTFISVLLAGALMEIQTEETALTAIYQAAFQEIWKGLPFAISLLSILVAHELGHYFAGRYHKTNVSLPYFIPVPFLAFGTLGAFIQLKEIPRNRRVLLDIGIAGPLAGLAVAVVVLIIGLNLSGVEPLAQVMLPINQAGVAEEFRSELQTISMEGNSILYLTMKYLVHNEWLPAPAGETNFIYWVKYLLTGQPIPAGGRDVMIHSVAFAGWAGILFTGLNLIPRGQLDGGHIIFALLGKKARYLQFVILGGLLALGLVWNGWWFWVFIIALLGQVFAEPLDQITQLNPGRKWLAWFGLLVFLITFTPIPMIYYLVLP